MDWNYGVELREDLIERDSQGRIIHHPLNSRYWVSWGKDIPYSYGYLTFAGHDLDKSSILDDVRVFYLEFFGEPSPSYREAWADPLRMDVLGRLTNESRCWYLSIILDTPIIVEAQTNFKGAERLRYTIVSSEKQKYYGKGFIPRLFVEVPNQQLVTVASDYWSKATPGYPIEGYNMGLKKIGLLDKWDATQRDDRLFREVVNEIFIAFYTVPSENRDFVFVTNKLSLDDMRQLLDLEALQQKARQLTSGIK